MALSCSKRSCFQYGSGQLVIKPQHLVEELAALDMMAPLVSIELHRIFDHLLLSDVLEYQEVWLVFIAFVFCLS